jgi:hypothetical protein
MCAARSAVAVSRRAASQPNERCSRASHLEDCFARNKGDGILAMPRVPDHHALAEGFCILVLRVEPGRHLLGRRVDVFDQRQLLDDPLAN